MGEIKEFNAALFGERLRELRIERAIGQNRLAHDLSLSNASISYWETGKQEPTASAIFSGAVPAKHCEAANTAMQAASRNVAARRSNEAAAQPRGV